MRRTVTLLAVLAAVAAVTLTVVWAAAGAGERRVSAAVSTGATPTPRAAPTPSAPGGPTEPTPAPPAGTGSPADYAQVAFDAWQTGDAVTLIRQASLPVVQVLLARSPGEEPWTGPSCDRAAGSTYCAWDSEGSQDVLRSRLVLRVASEAAAAGEAHAVTEAFFAPVDGDVAMWPLTTAEEAENTQASVDDGHSPWMVDPATVVEFLASAELGWEEPVVEPTGDTAFRVTDSATGVAADVEVAQPAREGEGGIWAVTRLGSASG